MLGKITTLYIFILSAFEVVTSSSVEQLTATVDNARKASFYLLTAQRNMTDATNQFTFIFYSFINNYGWFYICKAILFKYCYVIYMYVIYTNIFIPRFYFMPGHEVVFIVVASH